MDKPKEDDPSKKEKQVQKDLNSIVCVALFVSGISGVFIVLPVCWLYWQHKRWGFWGTWSHVFSGDIEWQSIWSFATFVVALFAAIIAYREFISHRSEHWDQARAHMQVTYFVVKTVIFVEVSNVGKTTATDIRVRLDKYDDNAEKALAELAQGAYSTDETITGGFRRGVLDRAISSIPPDSKMTYLLGFMKQKAALEKLSYKLEGTIEYKDLNGNDCPTDKFVLDFDDGKYMAWPQNDLDKISQSLKEIAKSCKS